MICISVPCLVIYVFEKPYSFLMYWFVCIDILHFTFITGKKRNQIRICKSLSLVIRFLVSKNIPEVLFYVSYIKHVICFHNLRCKVLLKYFLSINWYFFMKSIISFKDSNVLFRPCYQKLKIRDFISILDNLESRQFFLQ